MKLLVGSACTHLLVGRGVSGVVADGGVTALLGGGEKKLLSQLPAAGGVVAVAELRGLDGRERSAAHCVAKRSARRVNECRWEADLRGKDAKHAYSLTACACMLNCRPEM